MKKKVLVVDDSRVSRMLMVSHLKDLRPDWEISEAGNGQEAIDASAQSVFDLVTMDVNMPGINGLDAGEQIARSSPSTRVVIVSANVQEATRSKAQAANLGFVSKPINEQSVSRVVAEIEA